MKTNTYRNGSKSCRSYLKTVGNGYEVGFYYGGNPIFLGNFIHSGEANQFYSLMRNELRGFGMKFKVGGTYPQSWFKSFLSAHLQRCYYNFVNFQVRRHQMEAKKTYGKNVKTYRKLNRNWNFADKKPCLRAA